MTDPNQTTDPAKARFFMLAAMRFSGAALVLFGMAISLGKVSLLPKEAGFVIMVLGLIEFAVLPNIFAKRWRSGGAEGRERERDQERGSYLGKNRDD